MAANLKQKIKRGEQVVGFGIRGDIERDAFQRIAELGACDFVFVDSQHSPYSEDRLVALAGMIGEFDLPLHFRIKHTRHTYLIGNCLDLGPSGIEVPQVETAATAEEAVANFYYLPQGVRSHGGGARVGDASSGPQAYADWWNQYGVLWLQVESVAAATSAFNLARPGVDCLSFGPTDLQMDLNHRGHPHLKSVDDCVRHVVESLQGTDTAVCFPQWYSREPVALRRYGGASFSRSAADLGTQICYSRTAICASSQSIPND